MAAADEIHRTSTLLTANTAVIARTTDLPDERG